MPGSLVPAARAHAHLQCQPNLITLHIIKLLIHTMPTILLLLPPYNLPFADCALAERLHS